MDLNYLAKHLGSEDVYASFNLLMRRKPKVGRQGGWHSRALPHHRCGNMWLAGCRPHHECP